MDKGLWAASCFLVIFGMLLLAAGTVCRIYFNGREMWKGRTTARVVELLLQEPRQRDGRAPYKNCYYPVLEYYAEGRLYKVLYPKGAYPSPFHVNQELWVRYNQANPQEYKIEEKTPKRFAAGFLYWAGVSCVAAGCIIFVIFALRG